MKNIDDCPFCGYDKARVISRSHKTKQRDSHDRYIHEDQYYVMCNKCFARGPVSDTEESAVDSWNKCEVK